MVKRILMTLILVFLLAVPVASETLSEIWQLCRGNSTELLYKQNEISLARNKEMYDVSKGSNPVLSMDGSMHFPKDYSDGYRFTPVGFEESISFKGSLSSSTGLSLSLKNSINNNYRITGREIFSQSTSMSFSLNQSIAPYWLQGETKDPYEQILTMTTTRNSYSKESTEKSLMNDVTICYMRARKYSNLIDLTRRTIEIYDRILEVFDGMEGDVSLEMLNLGMNYRDSRWEQVLNLRSYVSEYSDLKMRLANYCGKEIDINANDELPDAMQSLFAYDPHQREIETQIRLSELEYILKRQSLAPQLMLSAGVSMSNTVENM